METALKAEPSEISDLDAAETEKIRLAVADIATQSGAGLALLAGTCYFVGGAYHVAFLWMGYSGVLIAARMGFKFHRLSIRSWTYLSTSPLLIASFLSVFLLGGIQHSNAIFIWAFFAPMLNLILLGIRESRIFFIAFLACLIVSAAIPSRSFANPSLPEWGDRMMLLFNLGAASVLLKRIFDFFVKERDRLRKQSNELLLNILPSDVAALLRRQRGVIAQGYENVSILFADLTNFTPLSSNLPPGDVVRVLNEVFTSFDDLIEKYGVEKIKTIGDCYMAAAGIPLPRLDHAEAIALVALEMRHYIRSHTFCDRQLQIRIGINSGPAVAGVIGQKKFSYDIWGDTVNTASRMESYADPDSIQITKATRDHLVDKFACSPMGSIEVKGKGKMEVWRLLGVKHGPSSLSDANSRDRRD